jgi:hypothetical protein
MSARLFLRRIALKSADILSAHFRQQAVRAFDRTHAILRIRSPKIWFREWGWSSAESEVCSITNRGGPSSTSQGLEYPLAEVCLNKRLMAREAAIRPAVGTVHATNRAKRCDLCLASARAEFSFKR